MYVTHKINFNDYCQRYLFQWYIYGFVRGVYQFCVQPVDVFYISAEARRKRCEAATRLIVALTSHYCTILSTSVICKDTDQSDIKHCPKEKKKSVICFGSLVSLYASPR